MASPSSPAATADQVMCQPMSTQHSTSTSSCGMVWYAATSIAATGKISRGIRIFWTRALFCQIDRVPPLQVSLK